MKKFNILVEDAYQNIVEGSNKLTATNSIEDMFIKSKKASPISRLILIATATFDDNLDTVEKLADLIGLSVKDTEKEIDKAISTGLIDWSLDWADPGYRLLKTK